jgi:DNA-binding response OmpR family regulator
MSAIILIAAGDPQRLARLKKLVESNGAVALPASDPVETMQVFVRREPDMAIIHLDSRHDIGLELCRDMKKLRTARHRAILVVGARDVRRAAFDAGCDAFVARQQEERQLSLAVHRFLNANRATRTYASIEAIA